MAYQQHGEGSGHKSAYQMREQQEFYRGDEGTIIAHWLFNTLTKVKLME